MMKIRHFETSDQAAAKSLINAGLGQHFGFVDESLNPDLDDIAATFATGCFLVGELDGALVATGGYKPIDKSTVQIERMSVREDFRRQGLASQLFAALLENARHAGYQRMILETTSTWDDVIAFWLRNGFTITHVDENGQWPETWFARSI